MVVSVKNLSKEEYLDDPKIRDSFRIGNAIQTLRKTQRNLKIGFTNGKFRILHPGHSVFLSVCRSKCDILIVGVNSDYSMRLLGVDPIFSGQERAFNLASLVVVDYVTIFDEETPFRCISEIDPDIIFKGGDYKKEDVVSAGRDVQIIDIPFPIHTSNFIKDKTEKRKYFNTE